MSARLQIRRGNNTPTIGTGGLIDYELGYNTVTNSLIINSGGTIKLLGAQNAQTIDGLDSTAFVRTNNGDQSIAGNLTLTGELKAVAESARYADVAEYYETDIAYKAGDILMFGVDAEATLADGSMPLMGVCSTKPGFLLNRDIEAEHFAPIALKGRVPVLITGEAERGDYIILDVEEAGKGKAVKSLEGIDKEKLYIGICISFEDGECEVKV